MEHGLIFDCDGVLADTELHGHLVAFNQMWKKLGIDWQWSPEQYAEKLKIGGGKERMASLFAEEDFRRIFPVPESKELTVYVEHPYRAASNFYYLAAAGRDLVCGCYNVLSHLFDYAPPPSP